MTRLLAGILAADTAPPRIATPQIAWRGLLPIVVLLVGGIVLLTIASLTRKRATTRWYAPFTVVVALAAAAATVPLWARVQGWDKLLWIDMPSSPRGPFSTAGGAVGIDGFGLFVAVVVCATVVLGALLAADYLRREGLNGPEFYALLLLAASGAVVMAMADDFIVLFLGLETMSIAAYVLSAMHLRRAQSQESGLKYFVLGGFSSAFLLYGIALIYGGTGSTSFIGIRNYFGAVPRTAASAAVPGHVPIHGGLILVGLALLLVGLGFKVAAVPFHSWSPDVYDGAPTPSVAFMAGAVKAGAFAALIRIFVLTFPNYVTDWRPIVIALAVLSMFVGSVLAIVQTNVKRMLAYSSINHAGFILVAVAASSSQGTSAVLFYLAAYAFMVAGSFGVVSLVSGRGDSHIALSDYRGLSRSNPLLAAALVVFLLAQAGVPFTSGFFAKFYVIGAIVDAKIYWLAVFAMVTAVIAAALYLRVIVVMYLAGGAHGDTEPPATPRVRVRLAARIAIGLCVLVTLGVGLFPETVVSLAQHGTPILIEPPAPTPPPPGTGEPTSTNPTTSTSSPSSLQLQSGS
ncbi:MAG: NADH-quinone oxidoreductase subunit N [Acidimicrobiales bacterium]